MQHRQRYHAPQVSVLMNQVKGGDSRDFVPEILVQVLVTASSRFGPFHCAPRIIPGIPTPHLTKHELVGPLSSRKREFWLSRQREGETGFHCRKSLIQDIATAHCMPAQKIRNAVIYDMIPLIS